MGNAREEGGVMVVWCGVVVVVVLVVVTLGYIVTLLHLRDLLRRGKDRWEGGRQRKKGSY